MPDAINILFIYPLPEHTMIQITLPLPCPNYMAVVAEQIKKTQLATMTGRLNMMVWFSPPHNRKIDLIKNTKEIIDALKLSGLFFNEDQIDKITIEYQRTTNGGQCIVHIKELK